MESPSSGYHWLVTEREELSLVACKRLDLVEEMDVVYSAREDHIGMDNSEGKRIDQHDLEKSATFGPEQKTE